jgi:hypothetical protein
LPQGGLIVFDDEQVIGLFGFDQIIGGCPAGCGALFHGNLADDDGFLMEDGTEQVGSWLGLSWLPRKGLPSTATAHPARGCWRASHWPISASSRSASIHARRAGSWVPKGAPSVWSLDARRRAEVLRPFSNGREAARLRQGATNGNGHNGHHRMAHPAWLAGVYQVFSRSTRPPSPASGRQLVSTSRDSPFVGNSGEIKGSH